MKILLIIFGIISFVLGTIGVILPILPTTPFLLLSAFLFSKSSDKFHQYLIQTKLYQKYINEMVIERKTTRKKRNQSLLTVTLVFLIAILITPVRNWKNMFINCDEYSSFYHVEESGDYQ